MANKTEAEIIEEYKAEIAKIADPVERRAKDRHFRIWIKRLQKNPNRRAAIATHEVVTAAIPIKGPDGKERVKTLSVLVSKNKQKHVSKPSELSREIDTHTEQIPEGTAVGKSGVVDEHSK